ncbi:hypothetical protein [Plantactinospora mayteni]|uniref:hypothetical protein n=1 Tax=Plantactinospora mayteni TaxID=566021 RepID=UPI0019432F23|nr:hypothetical protein [Plantactinospora mayteni]
MTAEPAYAPWLVFLGHCDPTRQLLDLAARHPGQPVTARLGRTGCRVHVPE